MNMTEKLLIIWKGRKKNPTQLKIMQNAFRFVEDLIYIFT
jgi:hypothetical protein